MSSPVRLLPLLCLKCQSPIPANKGEIAWVCGVCGQGQLLSMEKGLLPQEICFSDALQPGMVGKPFWVARGEVTVERELYSGNETKASAKFWAQPRWFFIPAYEIDLEGLISLGGSLLRNPPQLAPCAQATNKFLPVVMNPNDMIPLAEFIIMSIEAERKDFVREVRFHLELTKPELWVLP